MAKKKIQIFTDGACSPNPGAGGWGAVFLYHGQKPFYKNGGEKNSTNNRMELMAALKAFNSLDTSHEIELFTDSKYLKDGITKWLNGWKERNWLTAAKKPVKNKDLWEQIDKAATFHDVKWHWVKGHSENQWNEMADKLAVAGRSALDISSLEKTSTDLKNKNQSNQDVICIYAGITWKHKDKTGSWAIIMTYNSHVKVLAEPVVDSSANRLHIQTAINALLSLKKKLPVRFYTTSGYLKSGAESWLSAWQKRNWLTNDNKPVSNKDEWCQLSKLLRKYKVEFVLVDKTKEDNPCHALAAKEIAKQTV